MAKYDPLRDHLAAATTSRVELSFQRLEGILGATLPASARDHRAWWSNEVRGQHVQARAWLDVGFVVGSVDPMRGRVVFERTDR